MPGSPVSRRHITVRGVVQGVGFRPFVYRLARERGLAGWVLNRSGGVDIEVEGPAAELDAFLSDLRSLAPPLARIEGIAAADVPVAGDAGFEIRLSLSGEGDLPLISPDIATCPDCLRELLDPRDRRYHYPFTNCTNCGPRFTIIESVPYDRPRTTMRAFRMCALCQREYGDPLDRRFHAQPNACPACGPHLELRDSQGRAVAPAPEGEGQSPPAAGAGPDDRIIASAAALLVAGKILALKGLGGFHLACDATHPDAIAALRERKRRPAKPFAVMMASLEEVERHCEVNEAERALLRSPECPIVLLRWWANGGAVAPEVAPGNRYLGVMLPYTPLHHVLLRAAGRPLVMTSGNLSEEPIAQDNEEALRRLGGLADYFVLHDRGIYSRYDDSVWLVPGLAGDDGKPGLPQPVRRARGYAPFPVRLPFELPPLLAAGAELKNTFCLTRDRYAFVSQHIGDMENLETLEHYETTIALYERLFRTSPTAVAYDLHPDYLATQYARQRQARDELAGVAVQHHHAHIASCLADNGWPLDAGPAIGVCFDGTGYGPDGHIWGGEFLVGGYRDCARAAHLEYLPLPGGDAAVRHPYRIGLAYLSALFGPGSWEALRARMPRRPPDAAPTLFERAPAEVELIQRQVERGLQTPLTSSAGRLFDAVAALLGVRQHISYEAQAAIELEMLSSDARPGGGPAAAYPFVLTKRDGVGILEVRDLFEAILADLAGGRAAPEIGWRFHLTVADMIVQTCRWLAQQTGLWTVALSGGCFQNRLLLEMAAPALVDAGFRVLVHHQVPCNDGGLSLGQAVVAGLSLGAPGR